MDKDPNPMPRIDLFPRLTRISHFFLRCVRQLPDSPLASHGDHFQHPLDTPVEPVTHLPGDEV